MILTPLLQQNMSIVSKTQRLCESRLISAKADLESAKLYREAADIMDTKVQQPTSVGRHANSFLGHPQRDKKEKRKQTADTAVERRGSAGRVTGDFMTRGDVDQEGIRKNLEP